MDLFRPYVDRRNDGQHRPPARYQGRHRRPEAAAVVPEAAVRPSWAVEPTGLFPAHVPARPVGEATVPVQEIVEHRRAARVVARGVL